MSLHTYIHAYIIAFAYKESKSAPWALLKHLNIYNYFLVFKNTIRICNSWN